MQHAKAIAASFLWGIVPAYYYLVRAVEPLRMTAYRFVFTFLVLAAVSLILKKHYSLRIFRYSLVPAMLLSVNAYVYLVAVLHGHVLEAVYGYLITPVLTIAIGGIVLREPLSVGQLTGTLICLVAIILYAAMSHTLPCLALALHCPSLCTCSGTGGGVHARRSRRCSMNRW